MGNSFKDPKLSLKRLARGVRLSEETKANAIFVGAISSLVLVPGALIFGMAVFMPDTPGQKAGQELMSLAAEVRQVEELVASGEIKTQSSQVAHLCERLQVGLTPHQLLALGSGSRVLATATEFTDQWEKTRCAPKA